MKKVIHFFLPVVFALAVQQTLAQKKEIKSLSDLPSLSFSTENLDPSDSASVHAWLKGVAATEAPHLDSILKNYKLASQDIFWLLFLAKQSGYFISGNWEELKNTDTTLGSPTPLPSYIQKGLVLEFSAYANAAQQYSPDFSRDYLQAVRKSLEFSGSKEKQDVMNYALKFSTRFLGRRYHNEIEKIKTHAVVSDTALFATMINYAYSQAKTKIAGLLVQYTNELVKDGFTRADTLRGTINAERAWWNVLRYDITVKPDYSTKTIAGKNNIQYKVISNSHPSVMQIDLQEPLIIDSILFNSKTKLQYAKDGNAWHVAVPKQKDGSVNNVLIYYHGKVHEAVRPPWDGGFIWKTDSLGNPWISVACQGTGASIWYPCKDHQSDEPDNGASVTMIVPDTLQAVANGRLVSQQNNHDGTETYKWAVVNPINNYDISLYIGKYVHFGEVYKGEKGNLDVNYWVLSYNLQRAKAHTIPEVHRMLKSHEYWFGPYPFYEDGYKLVESPHLGMEHQSAVAYGNGYQNGAQGQDRSGGTGWGMKWDYIIVHESGHEWFGNNITSKDIADMWVHEGFTNYSEVLFTEYWYGKEAGNEYNYGLRSGIGNNFPVIGYYGVNDDISGRNQDMYPKGANLLHTIRHSMDNDSLFRMILRGLNKTFYHQTVTTSQIENYVSKQSGFDYSKVFDQYLRNPEIPQLEFYFSKDKKKVLYRYTNCIDGFNLPLVLQNDKAKMRIVPTKEWNSKDINNDEPSLFNQAAIEKKYYIAVKEKL